MYSFFFKYFIFNFLTNLKKIIHVHDLYHIKLGSYELLNYEPLNHLSYESLGLKT